VHESVYVSRKLGIIFLENQFFYILIAKIHMVYLITLFDVGFGSPTIGMPNNFVHFFLFP